MSEPGKWEEALREIGEENSDLLDNASDLIQSVTPEGRFLYVNKAWLEALCYEEKDLGSITLFDVIHPDSMKHCMEVFTSVIAGEDAKDVEAVFVTSDGRQVVVEGSASCRFVNGMPANTIGIFRDVTESKKTEEALAQSEERYRLLADTARDAIVTIDSGGDIVFANRSTEMMFGYPVDELMGRSITVLIPAGRREGFLGSFSGMVSGSANSSLENPIEMPGLRKDGTEFPTEYTVASWVTGGERFYAAIIRDVTDRRKAGEERERLLKRLNERLKELGALYWLSKLVETPGMTIDKILEGLVEILRAAWQYPEITYSRVALGRIEFRSDNYSDTAWKQSERIVVHGEAEGILEVGYLEYMPGEYEGPFLKEERRLIGAIAERLGRIVERTRAEEELQRSNIELQGFARTVSHDLKGPLTGIKLSVETLEGMLGDVLDEDSKGEIKELLEIASSGVDRSSRLIDDLLALAEAGQAKEDIEDVDVSGTVADILDDRAATIKERNVNVIVDDDLGHVEASPVHMYQVFANLIGNAIKHNKSDKPEITVKSLGADGESRRRYLIRDNGTGIPPENLDNIFIPFFKGAETGETGIGLSTVKKVVELYGGEIRAYNDEGACFEFTLPGSGESSIPGSDMTDKDTLFVPDD